MSSTIRLAMPQPEQAACAFASESASGPAHPGEETTGAGGRLCAVWPCRAMLMWTARRTSAEDGESEQMAGPMAAYLVGAALAVSAGCAADPGVPPTGDSSAGRAGLVRGGFTRLLSGVTARFGRAQHRGVEP